MVLRIFVAVLLLSLGAEWAVASPLRQRLRTVWQEVGQHADKLKGAVKHTGIAAGVAALVFMGGVAVSPLEAQQGLNIHWRDINDDSPAEFKSVFYLVAKGDTHDEQSYLEVIYVGNDKNGNALLMGNYLNWIVNNWGEAGLALYGYDGLIEDNIQLEEIEGGHFPILRGYAEISIHAAEGLNLSADYKPLDVRTFPFDDTEGKLEMVTYWHVYEHDHHYNIPAIYRTCRIVPNDGWNRVGVGASYCLPDGAWGSPLFWAKTRQVVGFHDGVSREVVTVASISKELVKFLRNIQNRPYAVSAGGKLPTTWGHIKSGQ